MTAPIHIDLYSDTHTLPTEAMRERAASGATYYPAAKEAGA